MTEAPVPDRLTWAEEQSARALKAVAKKLHVDRAWSGDWFRKLVDQHIHEHSATIDAAHWDLVYPGLDEEARAAAEIAHVAKRASLAGGLASVGCSTGELLSLFTDGLAAPIGLPAAAGSMLAEAAYTAMLQIDLACDLASIYGVSFDADDASDFSTLFSLALELPPPKRKSEEAGSVGLTERLLQLEDGEVGKRIGRKLLEESLMRNIVPVLGIPISARWNYVATRKFAAHVRRYVRYRRALLEGLKQVKFDKLAEPELLVEGAWLLASIDGEPDNETTMIISFIMDQLPEQSRLNIKGDHTFGDDEEGWFDALVLVPPSMHAPLLEVLYLIAAADRILVPAERRFLQRVGRTLSIAVDLERVEQFCRHLEMGESLPPGHSGNSK